MTATGKDAWGDAHHFPLGFLEGLPIPAFPVVGTHLRDRGFARHGRGLSPHPGWREVSVSMITSEAKDINVE